MTTTLVKMTAEDYKSSLPKYGRGVKWSIETYAKFVNLLYPHITVPLNQEWKGNASKLIHVCEKHGEYEARPNDVVKSYRGCQCKGCISEQHSASAGIRRQPRATQAEKDKAKLLRSEGKSYNEIGQILGRSDSTIRYWLKPEYAEKDNQRTAKWQSENREQHLATKRRYKSEFEHGRAAHNAGEALRRLQKQNTPEYVFIDGDWQEVDRKETYRVFSKSLLPQDERDAIQEVYEECNRLVTETGIEHHVDHIQPLSKGGEHLFVNLQILTAEENLSKNDEFRLEDQAELCQRYFN